MYDTYVHLGYLAGLRGQEPDPLLDRLRDYETGWLHGTEDRAAGVPDRFQEAPQGLAKGSSVMIPKGCTVRTFRGDRTAGRTYRVRIHDVYGVNPAHIGLEGFVRPEPARVIWPGTGGYWSTAAVLDLSISLS